MIIDRILDFPQRDVEHAMVPRSQVDSVTPDTTVGEVRALMATGHTRYPVIGDEDSPVGVVELIDLLREQLADDAPVASVMRTAVVIPSSAAPPPQSPSPFRTQPPAVQPPIRRNTSFTELLAYLFAPGDRPRCVPVPAPASARSRASVGLVTSPSWRSHPTPPCS